MKDADLWALFAAAARASMSDPTQTAELKADLAANAADELMKRFATRFEWRSDFNEYRRKP